jgi:prevent-host-death family protein
MPSKEFRRRLGEVLAGDETVVITNRGKRVAIVVPIESDLGPKVEKLMNPRGLSAFAGIIKTPYPTDYASEVDDVLYGPVSEEALGEGSQRKEAKHGAGSRA